MMDLTRIPLRRVKRDCRSTLEDELKNKVFINFYQLNPSL